MLLFATLALGATIDRVTLSDGQVLEGELQYLEEGRYRLFLKDGKVLDLPAGLVKSVQYDGDAEEARAIGSAGRRERPPRPEGFDLRDDLADDPTASRYVLGRSAWSMGHLSGFVAQEDLALTSVGLGITDYLDLTASSILPTMVSEFAATWCLDAKLSVPVGDRWRVALGAHQLGFGGEQATGFYAKAAIGRRYRHLGFGGGGVAANSTGSTGYFLNVEGLHRVGPGVAFLAEGWLVFRDSSQGGADAVFVPGAAMRFYTRRVSFDAGIVPLDFALFGDDGVLFPIPIFTVAYAWRGPT